MSSDRSVSGIGVGAVAVRPAAEREARACRILVPALFGPAESPDLLVAATADGRVVGAAALGTIFNVAPGRWLGFPVDVHVVPSFRRQGIGRALLAAVVERSRGRTSWLVALAAVDAGSDEASFMQACGFDAFDQIRHFEADAPAGLVKIAAIVQRLRRSRRIPPEATVVRLADAPRVETARMISRHFGAPVAEILRRLEPDAAQGYDLRFSAALMVDGVVRGVFAYRASAATPTVEVRLVDPTLRGGWANALLLEWTTRQIVQAGETRIRFFADERITDTMSLAGRADATEGLVQRHYRRAVTAVSGPAGA